jgi:phage tail protein X
MSSHREAPEIAKDPVADSTDVYAFVSPDKPGTVTLIANYIPLQSPAGGPNFYEFGDDVLYEIHVDNNGDGQADVSFQFRFRTTVRNPETFLYNTGPIQSLDSPNWNRRQSYDVSMSGRTIGTGLACPPCNIGPLSTPDYTALAAQAVHQLGGGITVYAGQRAEGFYVDLGAIFDLADLRPFEQLHATFGLPALQAAPGVNATNNVNVHSIAIQVPVSALTRSGHPTIGVWTTASRQRVRLWDADQGENVDSGPFRQVSRLGNPLVNEVLIPLGHKDQWNSLPPSDDKRFAAYVTQPGLAALLPVLYPGVFPNLAALVKSAKPRADLEAIFLTGIPAGLIAGFTNFTGSVLADMLRLNTSIPPTPSAKQSIYGLLGGDAAGFPNGRRVTDDVVAIELRALAGVTYPLIDKNFTPDAAAGELTDGLTPASVHAPYLGQFPYLGVPYSGYNEPH